MVVVVRFRSTLMIDTFSSFFVGSFAYNNMPSHFGPRSQWEWENWKWAEKKQKLFQRRTCAISHTKLNYSSRLSCVGRIFRFFFSLFWHLFIFHGTIMYTTFPHSLASSYFIHISFFLFFEMWCLTSAATRTLLIPTESRTNVKVKWNHNSNKINFNLCK